jgi:hypothetical protein
MNNMEQERIRFAAILRKDHCIVYGRDHAECFYKSPKDSCTKGSIQGFLTNRLRFVGRSEAAEIAFNAKQIGSFTAGQILMSEELWSEANGGKFDYDPIQGYVEKPQTT